MGAEERHPTSPDLEVAGDQFPFEEAAEPFRARRALSGWPLVLLGLAVFELTADPMLGVVLACLKFGWEDWLAGFWLLRVDSQRWRAWASGLQLAAFGFVKAGVAALVGWYGFLFTFMVIAITVGVPRAPAAVVSQYEGLLLVMRLCAWPFVVLGALGVTAALAGRVRVWIDGGVLRAHWVGHWPPFVSDPRVGREPRPIENLAIAVVMGVPLIAFLASVFAWPQIIDAMNMISDLPAPVRIPIAFGMLGASYVGMLGMGWLVKRTAAAGPEECWPELEAGAE